MTTAPVPALRWLYHVVLRDTWERVCAAPVYSPSDAHGDGANFIHTSYRDAVLDSARLYFPEGSARVILRLDPRRLGAMVRVVATPRGPMPHIHGSVPRDAIVEVYAEEVFARPGEAARAPDVVGEERPPLAPTRGQ